jgi:hypothetical protein
MAPPAPGGDASEGAGDDPAVALAARGRGASPYSLKPDVIVRPPARGPARPPGAGARVRPAPEPGSALADDPFVAEALAKLRARLKTS